MPAENSLSNVSLRVGAVNYLNSKPLVYDLQQRLPHSSVRFDLPSRLADSLVADRLDIALVPVVEALRQPGCRFISNACVASHGAVLSVKLYFRRPPESVRTLALDEGSRTSAALARVMLAERYDVRPELRQLPLGCGSETVDTDAVLLIGDRAMHSANEPFVTEWDLGAEWRGWTGLPFVFACWAVREEAPLDAIAETMVAHTLNSARDAGLAAIPQIAAQQAPLLGIEAPVAEGYLANNLHFHLGPEELRGLRLFQQYCLSHGLLTHVDVA